MDIIIDLVGTSPLLCHNPQMVDPEFGLNRDIKAITSKRKKTEDDLKKIEECEWFGGLYHDVIDGKDIVVQPAAKLRKCLINTARIFKMGKQIERAISFTALNVPLVHDGPADIKELFKLPRFHSRLSVGLAGKRVMRVRPQFNPWALHVPGVFLQDAGLSWEDLERIVVLSGQAEGIGDNRVNGYGRFLATLKEVK